MVLKASDIRAFYTEEEGEERFLDVIEDFIRSLDNIGVRINFCYSVFNSSMLEDNKVKTYGTRGVSEKKMSISKFIDRLYSYYSYVPAWKTSKIVRLHDIQVMVDCFTGETTNAWKELRAHHSNIVVVPNGDQVNPFISASDIVTRYFNDKLRSNNIKLYSPNIEMIGKYLELNHFKCFSVSNPDLNDIKPLSNSKVITQRYFPDMIYLIREGSEIERKFNIDEKSTIENSPLWTNLLNEAFRRGCGLKYLDSDHDLRSSRESRDIIAYYSDIGKKKAEYYRSLGHTHRIMSVQELQSCEKEKSGL